MNNTSIYQYYTNVKSHKSASQSPTKTQNSPNCTARNKLKHLYTTQLRASRRLVISKLTALPAWLYSLSHTPCSLRCRGCCPSALIAQERVQHPATSIAVTPVACFVRSMAIQPDNAVNRVDERQSAPRVTKTRTETVLMGFL